MPDRRPEDDRLVEQLLRHAGPPSTGTGEDCPGADLLVGLLEDRLLTEERALLEAHLVGCGGCRARLAGLARREGVLEPFRPRRPILLRPFWLAAAAAVLAALATTIAFQLRPRSVDVLLADASAGLRRSRPDLFGGFEPLGLVALKSQGPLLERAAGDPVPLHPAGVVLDPRPAFRWEPAHGATAHTVTLYGPQGGRLFEARGGSGAPFPADARDLAPGSGYLWEVSGEGPAGRAQARRIFSVAPPEARARFEEARREIEARAPARVRALLLAHRALSLRHFAEAEAAARAAVAELPDEPMARETLAHVLRLLGAR
jgi:hypothetical protein